MNLTHERCFLCSFWNGDRCTQTWRLVVHIEPNGGQVDFQTTPGMVPEELKPRIGEYFQKLINRLLLVTDMMPFWDEVREFQLAKPERADCPARRVREDIKPFLKVVKT